MRRRGQTGGGWLEGLCALSVFALFAGCVLSVLLMGADSVRRMNERDSASFRRRTCVPYAAARIREADAPGVVSVGTFTTPGAAEGDTLFLWQTIDGERWCTRVYCWDGFVRELFAADGEDLDPAAGEKILEAKALRFEHADGRIVIRAEDPQGGTTELTVALRAEADGT